MATTNPNPRPSWDVHNPHSKAGQWFVTNMRKIYHPIGFQRGYNFPLFLIGFGGLMGFTLSRMPYWNLDHFAKETIPGEWFYYRQGYYYVGIIIHLIGAIGGGFLACFQFIPIIRHKFILFHRLNGYLAIILMLVGNAGAYMIMTVSVGGPANFQVWVGVIGSMITLGLFMAIWNVKRLQIDQHRAWMLRVWTWAGNIATQRLLLEASRHVVRVYGYVFYKSFPCAELFFMYQHIGVPDSSNPTGQLYPACNTVQNQAGLPTGEQINPAVNMATWVSVSSAGRGPEASAVVIHNVFPAAAWLALFLHALAIEVYLWLTPAENYKLRNVSYEKQIEKGYRVRGAFKDAGLTSTRIGSAPDWWSIPAQDYETEKLRMAEGEEVSRPEPKHLPSGNSASEESDGTLMNH